ncbi:MAG: hypothetical protein QXW98_07040 [Candidatus Caldarchaeum sp.]
MLKAQMTRELAVSVVLLCVALAQAQTFGYQGFLVIGTSPANGNYDFQFRLFSAATGGTQLGSTLTVTNVRVTDGHYYVSLNFGNQWSGAARWLEIAYRPAGSGSYTTISTRQPLEPTPYALYAFTAGSANPTGAAGGDLSGTYPNPTVSRLQGRPVSSAAPSVGQSLVWNGNAWAPSTVTLPLPFTGTASPTSGDLANPGAVFRINNGATGQDVAAIYGFALGTSQRNHGVFGRTGSPLGHGVFGINTAVSGAAVGVFGRTESVEGAAVRGFANAATGTAYGVWGESRSSSGVGTLGLTTSTTGETIGVVGISRSSGGTGVFGWASATAGLTYGIEGWSDSDTGRGVFGWALSNTGSGIGVEGWSNGNSEAIGVRGWARALTGTTYGVVGISDSFDGYGVFSMGDSAATGLKAFRIDHPLNPETHYLNHFCAEAPEPYNIYSGIVQLNERGEAWVQLPDYFEAINRDPRYVLTAVGAPMPNLHVAVEIQNNRFKIAGGAPNAKVSWEVKAVRNDRYVQQRGFRTVEEKPQEHQGRYLHPELYGQPRERGILFTLPNPQTPRNHLIHNRAE